MAISHRTDRGCGIFLVLFVILFTVWWDSTKASAQAQDKTMQYGLYGTQTAVSTHTRELKPQLLFLTSDSNRQKQIKWGWDSTVHVWSRFCWNTKMHIWTFFQQKLQQKKGLRFSQYFAQQSQIWTTSTCGLCKMHAEVYGIAQLNMFDCNKRIKQSHVNKWREKVQRNIRLLFSSSHGHNSRALRFNN